MARRGFPWVLVAVAACGGGAPTAPPDAPLAVDAARPPDAPTGFTACGELTGATPHAVPAHVSGALAGADLSAPAACATIDAPFGVASAGPDSVVRLDGLIVGTTYVVQLAAQSDLSFYVVDGCSTATGPSSAQCLLFEDAAKAGVDEVGTFVATAPTQYVVVDYYASSPPADVAFTLDAYAQTCATGAGCTVDAPVCSDGRCVECATSFDCTSAQRSTCNSATHTCESGQNACTSDDASSPADNGPAGAPVVVLDSSGRGSVNGLICSAPLTEVDYVAFDVTTVGEIWDLNLSWSGPRDLDLEIDDAAGNTLGLSFYEHPETIRLTYLAPGRYYARIRDFSTTANPSPVAYAFNALRSQGTGCTSTADCAAEYRNQVFRGACTAGSCVAITGAGAVPQGGHCDSQNDCAAGLGCPSFYFVAEGDTRETCEPTCATDGDCAVLGGGFVCTTYATTNFCVLRCADDDDCPVALNTQPTTLPWYRLTCNLSSGRCVP